MYRHFRTVLAAALLSAASLHAQAPVPLPSCPHTGPTINPGELGTGNPTTMQANPLAFPGNGVYMTSHGPIKVLFVMIEFPDDNFQPNSNFWPVDNAIIPGFREPFWVTDPEMLVTSVAHFGGTWQYTPYSLSEYFYTMSSNMAEPQRLKMYGTHMHVTFPYTREQTLQVNGQTNLQGHPIPLHEATQIAMGQLDIANDFAIYDMWKNTGDYANAQQANTYLDLVIFCWRNMQRDLDAVNDAAVINGLQAFGYMNATQAEVPGGTVIAIDNNGGGPQRYVYCDYPGFLVGNGDRGCSIFFRDFLDGTLRDRSSGAHDGYFRGLVHEIGHHLFGKDPVFHPLSGPWDLIANGDHRSYAPNAFNMATLGWITPQLIRKGTNTNTVYPLGDLYTTGQNFFIEVDSVSNRWYAVENHQMISPYDYTTSNDVIRNSTKGVYMLFHDDDNTIAGARIEQVQSAAGAYNWTAPATVPAPWDPTQMLPQFIQGTANPSTGSTRSELIYFSPSLLGKNWHAIYATLAPIGPQMPHYFLGYIPGDQHDVCYKPVWSPWTNPRSLFLNKPTNTVVSSGATVSLLSLTAGTYQVRVGTDSIPVGPPAMPELIGITPWAAMINLPTPSTPSHIIANMDWEDNTEPDFQKYRVYRRYQLAQAWTLIAQPTTSSYRDSCVIDTGNVGPPTGITDMVYYQVRAVDTNGLESPNCGNSFLFNIDWTTPPGWSFNPDDDPTSTVAAQGTTRRTLRVQPNPATSTIALWPELTGSLHITISDMKGRVVMEFAAERLGYDGLNLDVSQYPAGMYFVRIDGNATSESTIFSVAR